MNRPSREETKAKLKDWMTSTCQLLKVQDPVRMNSDEITFWWKVKFGIWMRSRWVEKALYGRPKNER